MNNYTFKFKINNPSSEERKSTFEKIKNAYPNKLPIICEKHPEENELEELTTSKFIFPDNLTLFDFKIMIQKKFKNLIFINLFHNNEILENMPMKEVFEKYKDPEDNFIYVFYKKIPININKFKFKDDNLLKDRIETFKSLSKKYPNKILIICEKDPDCDEIKELDKTKYIISKECKIIQFILLLQHKINFSCKICIKINDEIIDENEILNNIYEKYKDKEDNFLYCFYSKKTSNSQSNSYSNSKSNSKSNSYSNSKSNSLLNSFEDESENYEFQYKKNTTLEERKETYKMLIKNFPDKIPIICEKHPKSKLKQLDKSKYLINNKMTLNEFKLEIEKKFPKKTEIFIFIKDKFINSNLLMSELYKDEEDNFLYCFYSETDDFSTKFNDNNEEKNNDDDDNESYEYDDENNSFEYKDDDDDD